mgnify:CR=1 FL=1
MSIQFLISNFLIGIGLFLWFWGTIPVLNKLHNFLYKLHTLTVSDTVGSVFIILASVWLIFGRLEPGIQILAQIVWLTHSAAVRIWRRLPWRGSTDRA